MTETTPWAATFVETMGLLWEGEGLPRIAGRIFGFLSLQTEPCSLDDLALALGVSKASVSTDARRLEGLGLIHRVGVPADRRDYYTVVPDVPARMLAIKIEQLQRFETALAPLIEAPELPAVVKARIMESRLTHKRIMSTLRELLIELRQGATPPPQPATTTI
ncbi:MAG TPA: MarR family transcriptional regulator [Gemmatimonadaceae bacterium]|nr:MarR family transcriptional regulator [Gemmatimonadaceae bacterium]